MKNNKTLRLVQLALLVAVLLVLEITQIGYISTGGIEITLMMIPVVIGAILLGPKAGAILGAIFGLTSFGTCLGIGHPSPLGAALLQINPWMTFAMCFIPRLLAGWFTGLVFQALYRKNARPFRKNMAFGVTAFVGPMFNTILFMGTLVAFFYQTDIIQNFVAALGAANPLIFILLFAGINAAIEIAVGFVVSGALSRALYNVVNRTAPNPA